MVNVLDCGQLVSEFELRFRIKLVIKPIMRWYYLPNPSARAGYDTRSIFKRSFNRFEFRVFLLLD